MKDPLNEIFVEKHPQEVYDKMKKQKVIFVNKRKTFDQSSAEIVIEKQQQKIKDLEKDNRHWPDNPNH